MDYIVMCIGNKESGDDAVGPYVAEKLKKTYSKDILVLDCEIAPENYTSIVKSNRPKLLVLVDAVEMGLKPGEIRIVPKEKIGAMHISTHGIPIPTLIDYLEPYAEKIVLIGIQPKTLSGKITIIVKKSGNKVVEILKNKEIEKIKILQ